MKNVKTKILCIILLLAMTFAACSNVLYIFGREIANMDTPIAQVTDDSYTSYADRNKEEMANSLAATAELYGGSADSYNNEQEYLDAQNDNNISVDTAQPTASVQSVKMTIQLIERVNSKPVANAIVRLNGVPRFSDRDGIVRVTLSDPVYELYVTKETKAGERFNPHMEFIYIEDFAETATKTIKLKRPSDDLDITAVNLRIGSATSATPEYYNLMEQEYHFAIDYMDYPADIIFETNILADYCMLYRNGELDRTAIGNDFIYFDYNKLDDDGTPYYKEGDTFAVQFVYSGIKSKMYDIQLYFQNIDDIETPDVNPDDDTPQLGGGPDESQDMGFFGKFEFDFVKFYNMVDDMTKSSTKGIHKPGLRKMDSNAGTWAPKFTALYNPRDNSLELLFGVEFNKRKENNATELQKLKEYQDAADKMNDIYRQKTKTQSDLTAKQNEISELEKKKKEEIHNVIEINEQIAKQRAEYNKMTEAYLAAERLNNEGAYEQRVRNGDNHVRDAFKQNAQSLADITDQLANAKGAGQALLGKLDELKSIRSNTAPGTGMLNNKLGIVFQFEIVGRWKINLTDNSITEFKISGEVSIKVSYTYQFIILYVPVYARVEGGIMGRIDVIIAKNGQNTKIEEFWKNFLVTIDLSLRGDVGIGLYDVLSVGGFVKGGLKFEINIGEVKEKEPYKETYGKFYLQIGIKATVLFIDFEFKYPSKNDGWEWYLFGNGDNAKLQSRTTAANSLDITSDEALFKSAYQDARPQLTDLGNGEMLMTWLADNPNRDGLNRTELQYSIFRNGAWGEALSVTLDSGKADFYPQVYASGEDVHIAWQRASRYIGAQDDIRAMSAAGEIWTAKLDTISGKFVDQQQITDNDTMDLMPKFAIRERLDDPIALIWQRNSEDDILGVTGSNSIVSSTFNYGVWSSPQTLYASDNIVTHVSAAIKDGDITIAFVEDTDKDPLTAEDRIIKAVSRGKIVFSDQINVANTQFAQLGDEIVLFYYKNGDIMYTEDYQTMELAISSENDEFALGFRVASNDNGTAIYYEKNGEEYKQGFCAVYDSAADSWDSGIRLTNAVGNVSGITGYISNSGEIAFAYVATNEAEEYSAICYSVKDCSYGIAITEATYMGNVIDGENISIAFTIENTGDYSIGILLVDIFGQTENIKLESPLSVGEVRSIVVDRVANTQGKTSTMISVNAINGNTISASAQYDLFYAYVDYALSAEISIIDGVQRASITVDSEAIYHGTATINIYINGELRETVTVDNMCADGKPYVYEYAFDDVKQGDYVYIELVSPLEKVISNNSYGFKLLRDSIVEKPYIPNPYIDALNIAKGWLI